MQGIPRIRQLTRTVAYAAAGAILVAGVTLADEPTEAAGGLPAGSLAQFVGFEEPARFANIESALGRPLDRVVVMTGNSTPSSMRSSIYGQFANSTAYLPGLSDRLDVTVTIPLAFGEKAPYQKHGPEAVLKGLKMTSSGAYDADYRTVARNLIAAGYPDAVLRLGHEFDGTWVQWSARDNEQGYIDAFRHVRSVFAEESRAFRFEWTGMRAPWMLHAKGAYPGDAYVDIIGLDIYYRSPGEITDKVWGQYTRTLVGHRDFAISRGKPVSYPEWGRAYGDTDRFISLMHGWFDGLPKSGPGRLEYQSYFNTPHNGGNYDLDKHPTVKRRYLELFRITASAVTVSPDSMSTAPTTTALETPDRSALDTPEPKTTESPVSASVPSIALVPRSAALELTWSYPGAERRNVRYRALGSTEWTWPGNGAWTQVISGLRPDTGYEVQVRGMVDGAWQPWLKATATTK